MKALKRNQKLLYYCLYSGKIDAMDEFGNYSGQYIITYEDAVPMMANVSQATGQSNTEQFGNLENYDKVIVTDWMDCPIDEHSVLFIDKEPEYTDALNHVATAITTTDETITVPVYDYTVLRVAKSINSISIAVKKVDVS